MGGNGAATACPDAALNRFDPEHAAAVLLSVQSVVVDPENRLWALDTANPKFEGVIPGGPKLVAFDLGRNAPSPRRSRSPATWRFGRLTSTT